MTPTNNKAWDREGSCYVRIINFADGKTLTGYSKMSNCNERRNQIDSLTNFIVWDYRNGYLDHRSDKALANPTTSIDYYINRTNERILSLTYSAPDWTPKGADQIKLRNWVNSLYMLIRQNKSVSEIEDSLMVRTRERERNELDYTSPRFLNTVDLEQYYRLLLNQDRHPRESIHHFYREYKAKWFSNVNRATI